MANSGDKLKQNLAEILTVCRFYVGLQLDGSTEPVDAYFMECKGFKYSQDVMEIAEVFPQPWGQAKRGRIFRTKIPGNVKYNNITLRRGLSASTTLWNWIKTVQDGNWAKQFRNGYLAIYRQDGSEGARFSFERAWPISYNVADSVVSGTELAFEELELAVETLVRVALKEDKPLLSPVKSVNKTNPEAVPSSQKPELDTVLSKPENPLNMIAENVIKEAVNAGKDLLKDQLLNLQEAKKEPVKKPQSQAKPKSPLKPTKPPIKQKSPNSKAQPQAPKKPPNNKPQPKQPPGSKPQLRRGGKKK